MGTNYQNILSQVRAPPTEQDCAVCLQKCHHPTQLPCGHVFCFLCVKGVAIQSKKCAMCRAEIPSDYLDNPVLLETVLPEQSNTEHVQIEYQWYYEGRNGWWKYDERSNVELESSFNNGEAMCTLLLAGAVYNIDFQSMTQVRRSDQTRRRHVRRDSPTFPSKGIAGIKSDKRQTEPLKNDNEGLNITSNQMEETIIVLEDDDDDVEVVSESVPTRDEVSGIVDRLRIMNIQEHDSSRDSITEDT